MRTLTVARLFFDNIAHIQGSWVTQGERVGQLTLGFGADDIDGTVHKETILHDAGATSPEALSEDRIIRIIREAGRVPAPCDCNYHILRRLDGKADFAPAAAARAAH